ncbi:hypothetical protein Tco_0778912 [Tanacetum coccineum]
MDGTLTSFNMLVEKRYPLIKEMLQKMLNWKLEAEAESTMAFELLKFIKECRTPRNHNDKNREGSRRSMPIETTTSNALISCDGLGGYDWSDQEKEGPTNYALMAYSSSSSDSKVSNDSTYSKSCLKTVEVLKSQYEQLLKRFEKFELMVIAYKTVPPPLIGNFMPPKPDLSFTGLEEFTSEPVVIKSVVESEGVVKTAEERINVVEEVANIIDVAKSVSVVGENINVVEETVSAASEIPTVTTADELTLAQALAELKSARPPTQGISFREPIPVVGKEKPMKKQEQMRIDEELAFKLQAEEEKEERLAREKAQQIEESNIA